MNTDQLTPDRATEIPEQMKLLSDSVTVLNCLIDRVADRVNSVLSVEPPEGLPLDETDCHTTLGREIQALRFRIESMCKIAKRMANGIEL